MTEHGLSTAAVIRRRGGRPTRLEAGQIREQILNLATEMFLGHGYGATSIEAIAKRARISKRTFYHRFSDKAELFGAVVHRLIDGLRPPAETPLFDGGTVEEILHRLARLMIRAALAPQALALHRVIVAEASRFPELAKAVNDQGSRSEAITRIGALLERSARAGALSVDDAAFAAEQFIHMVVSAPQRRALGLGAPMTGAELDAWADASVELFLKGCRARPPAHPAG